MRHATRSEPFYGAIPLGAVALFVLNNFWLKSALPGVVTGKLSDVCACFFVPLFVAAVLREVSPWALLTRLHYGAAVMVAGLSCVKATEAGSGLLNAIIAHATAWSGLIFRPNVPDATDLHALPVVALSYLYALGPPDMSLRRSMSEMVETPSGHEAPP